MEEAKMIKRYDEQGAIVRYFMRDRIVPPKEFIKAAKDWENYQPQLQEALDAMRNAQERRRDIDVIKQEIENIHYANVKKQRDLEYKLEKIMDILESNRKRGDNEEKY